MAEVTDEIRARVDIVELVGQRVALKRAGKDWKGLCPFHDDKNPSFQVSPTSGRYRCWSCGESGDAFTWVMKTQNVEFVEALKVLAAHTGVALPKDSRRTEPSKRAAQDAAMAEALSFFRAQLDKNPAAKDYCDGRGLDDAARQMWELGYAPNEGSALATQLKKKGHSLTESRSLFLVEEDSGGGYFDRFRGRLMFPIRDERGDLVAFGGRILGDGHPKYVNSGDTPLFHKSRVLYGMYRAKESIAKERKAVLVEGYLDVIACHQAGVINAIASLGTALTEDHAKILKRWCDGVIVLYDSDNAGQKAAERAIEILESAGLKVRIVLLPQGEDPDTILRRDGPGTLKRAVETLLTPTEYRLELLKKRVTVDQEDFWSEAVRLLATTSNRESEPLIMRLAPLHPQMRDQQVAAARIRADVVALRKGQGRQSWAPKPNGAIRKSVLLITSAERTLFQGFLGEAHRAKAFEIIGQSDLFETKQAMELGAAIHAAFKTPPSGLPAEWLHNLDADSSQMMVDLDLEQADPISSEVIEDTAELLRKRLAKRQLNQLKGQIVDDEGKTAYLQRLRKLNKGEQQ